MPGLRDICRAYGGIRIKRSDGVADEWVWDYVQDRPRLASEMKAEERAASERRKRQRAAEKRKQGDLG